MDFEIGQNDTTPLFTDRIRDPNTGQPVDLSGATSATLKTWPAGCADRATKVTATLTDARAGCVSAPFPTNHPGVYLAQWIISWTSPPAQLTYPPGDYRRVSVTPSPR